MIKKQKIEAIAIKYNRNKREISLFSKKKDDYNNNTIDNIDSNEAKAKYLVLRLNRGKTTNN